VTTRIPRTGQLRLSGHISASFNQNAGNQTHMNNTAVEAALHNTSTFTPTQRQMSAAYGLITCLVPDRYVNTGVNSSYWLWAQDINTVNTHYNTCDCRADGAIYSGVNSPSVNTVGTTGQEINMYSYGDSPGAIYANTFKNVGSSGYESINIQTKSSGQSVGGWGWGCSSNCYLVGYNVGYLDGSRGIDLYHGLSSSSSSNVQTNNHSSVAIGYYPALIIGYRGFTQYPGYNSRGGYITSQLHYFRATATSGYA